MSGGDLTALILSLREGVEMTLVVGIVLAYLGRVGASKARPYAWAGVGAAVAVSVLALGVLNALNAEFEGAPEQIFEGGTMLVAAGFLTWMVLWMLRRARFLRSELQEGVQTVLAGGRATWGIFFLVFFAVVREGVELALLLFAAPGEGKVLGSAAGLTIAVAIGLGIYAFGRRIDLRAFFRVTTAILVLFAAGLVSHAMHEFAEAGLIERLEGPLLWSTRSMLPDDQGLGSILSALVGYADSPHLIEVVAYVAYVAGTWLVSRTRFVLAPPTAEAPAIRPA